MEGSCGSGVKRQAGHSATEHSKPTLRRLASTCPSSRNTVRLCDALQFASGGGRIITGAHSAVRRGRLWWLSLSGWLSGSIPPSSATELRTQCPAMDSHSRAASEICCGPPHPSRRAAEKSPLATRQVSRHICKTIFTLL